MAESGDIFNEFKQAKPPEKIFLIGGGIAVIAILLYLHSQSGGGAKSQATDTSGGGATGAGGIQTVPTGQQGQVPLLPTAQWGGPAFTPTFDQNGTLIGYEPTPPPAPAPPTVPPPTGSHGHHRPPHVASSPNEKTMGAGALRREGRQDIGQGRTDIRQAGNRQFTNPTNAATRGGLRQGVRPMPTTRPQRANPTMQHGAVAQTAARTKTRG